MINDAVRALKTIPKVSGVTQSTNGFEGSAEEFLNQFFSS